MSNASIDALFDLLGYVFVVFLFIATNRRIDKLEERVDRREEQGRGL